jgi:hypothetical protein
MRNSTLPSIVQLLWGDVAACNLIVSLQQTHVNAYSYGLSLNTMYGLVSPISKAA